MTPSATVETRTEDFKVSPVSRDIACVPFTTFSEISSPNRLRAKRGEPIAWPSRRAANECEENEQPPTANHGVCVEFEEHEQRKSEKGLPFFVEQARRGEGYGRLCGRV